LRRSSAGIPGKSRLVDAALRLVKGHPPALHRIGDEFGCLNAYLSFLIEPQFEIARLEIKRGLGIDRHLHHEKILRIVRLRSAGNGMDQVFGANRKTIELRVGGIIGNLGAWTGEADDGACNYSEHAKPVEPQACSLRIFYAPMNRNSLAEWVFNFVILIFATGSIAQPFVIPSASMESTLMTGDHVLVDKMAYGPSDAISRHLLPYEQVRHGDIVVFRYPIDERQNFVKRVIGVPGDRVHLDNGVLYRNGMKVIEPYVQHIAAFPDAYRDDFPNAPPSGQVFEPAFAMLAHCVKDGELIVPEGSYLVMGDNRDNSSDGRYWGLVPAANILGRPVVVWWSYEASDKELTDFINIHHVFDIATHFFTKTRWSRTMRVVRGAS